MATPHARSSLRRTACDRGRCRQSKLRCLRDENREKCVRCLRLELRCEVAPAKPPGRPRKVVSTPSLLEATSHAESSTPRSSPESLGTGDHSPPRAQTPDSRNRAPPDQGLGNVLPRLDGERHVIGEFGHTPLPSHSDVNGYSFTSLVPHPEFRTPEGYETGCFDPGPPPSRDPLEVHSLFTAKLDRHECLKELSQLNVDLHNQWMALQALMDSDRINFAAFCEHPPPPAGDGVSLAEKFLIMSQRFQQAITNLNWVVKNEPRPLHPIAPAILDDDMVLDPLLNIEGPLPIPRNPDPETSQSAPEGTVAEHNQLLETPFACLLVSCYVQLISLWEVMFIHVNRRVSGEDRSQLTLSDPSKGIQMGAFYIFSGRLQSMFFCQAVLYFQDNIDRGLGILPEQREQGWSGLLSHPQHFNLLQRELGGGVSKGGSERVRELRDAVERTRVFSFHDIGW
ncbi:hypothetical protein F5Y06DRAFT_173487 [Hypoxylon sp. FL0890]|nr:hypothetical protein F5Y06DRAFT_173487 [Hypoxylon sp. FL0890]